MEFAVEAGESLFVEGQTSSDLIVILDGHADIVYLDPATELETIIATHGAGRFFGELSLLTGQRTYLRGRMQTDGSVLRIGSSEFRRLLASDAEIGDIVFAALVARRDIIVRGAGSGSIRIIGSRYSSRALELLGYVRRQRLPHRWVDLDGDDVDDVEVLLAGIGVRLGAQITSPCSIEQIEAVCDGYRLSLGDGAELMARAVVIALGVQYRKLPLDRLEEFEGAGVYYAARV